MNDTEFSPELDGYASDPAEYLSADNEYRNFFARKLSMNLDRIKSMLLTAPSFIAAVKASIPMSALRPVLSLPQKIRLDKGSVKLCFDKNGRLLAMIRNTKNGQWAGHIELKEVQLNPDLTNALTSFAMQLQMAQIVGLLQEITQTMRNVLRGQENDRLAEAYACRQNLLTAAMITEPGLKYQALIHIAQSSEAARQKLMLSQKDTLDFIEKQPEDLIGKILKGASPAKIEEAINKLCVGLDAINSASITEAVAYLEMNEPEAAARSLTVYSQYLDASYARPKMVELLDLNTGQPNSYWSEKLNGIKENIISLPCSDTVDLLKGE